MVYIGRLPLADGRAIFFHFVAKVCSVRSL